MPQPYRKIPIDQIQSSSHQARKDFDFESLTSLSESIKPLLAQLDAGWKRAES